MNTQPRSSRAHSSSSGYGSAISSTWSPPPERFTTHSSRRRQAAVSVGDHEYMRAEATGIMQLATVAPRLALVKFLESLARGEFVAVVRPGPLAVVQVVAEADGREREPEVVEDDVET